MKIVILPVEYTVLQYVWDAVHLGKHANYPLEEQVMNELEEQVRKIIDHWVCNKVLDEIHNYEIN